MNYKILILYIVLKKINAVTNVKNVNKMILIYVLHVKGMGEKYQTIVNVIKD